MCYVLLVIQLLRMNGFFLSVMDFFLCAIVFIRSAVWVIRGVTCKLPVYGRIFPVCCGLFPVTHIWAFVHQSSMFRVVVVLCAVSYTVEYEWIFPLCYGFFSCVSWSTLCSFYIFLFFKVHPALIDGAQNLRLFPLSYFAGSEVKLVYKLPATRSEWNWKHAAVRWTWCHSHLNTNAFVAEAETATGWPDED